MKLYNKLIDLATSLLSRTPKGINILEEEWDHLIVLDACRCDTFAKLYKYFFPGHASFKCIYSTASSTMEFVRKNILENPAIIKKLRNTVFINANPVIDNVLGNKTRKYFHTYIPVWKKYWNEKLGTVEPQYTYKETLRAIIKHPDKKTITWFLQPHYPYIHRKYQHLNTQAQQFMNKAIHGGTDTTLQALTRITKTLLHKGYLCAGIPETVCEHMHRNKTEVMKAYLANLATALKYVKKLAKTLPGTTIVTADHGEAFGETLNPLLPIHVYGHPSRIRIDALRKVPYLPIENTNYNKNKLIRNILKEIVSLRTAGNKGRKHL